MHPAAVESTYGLVGQSPEIAAVRRLIEKASRNRLPVLLLGESGLARKLSREPSTAPILAANSFPSIADLWSER